VIIYGAFGINKIQIKIPITNIILLNFSALEKDKRRELIINGIKAKSIFHKI
jgi:hypothetical protein